MSLVVVVLLATAIIILGAAVGRPLGWVAIGLALLAFLLCVVGPIRIGQSWPLSDDKRLVTV